MTTRGRQDQERDEADSWEDGALRALRRPPPDREQQTQPPQVQPDERLNGNNIADLRASSELMQAQPAKAQRRSAVTAVWTARDRSRVTAGESRMDINEPGTLDPMALLLAALAGCLIDVISTHATLMRVAIEELSVEVAGDFDLRSYFGLEGAPPAGYGSISYTARLRAPAITDEQLARLTELARRGSPVADSLVRPVRLEGRIERLGGSA